jgi:HSP20 family protein
MSRVNRLPAMWTRLNQFGQEWNRTLQDWAAGAGQQLGLAATFPLVNVWEDPNAFHVEAELPGLSREQLSLEVAHRNQVTISGERKVPEQEGMWHRRERVTGRFERVLTFPVPIDAEKVEAKLENGVLQLTLPKAEEARPRKITVNAG